MRRGVAFTAVLLVEACAAFTSDTGAGQGTGADAAAQDGAPSGADATGTGPKNGADATPDAPGPPDGAPPDDLDAPADGNPTAAACAAIACDLLVTACLNTGCGGCNPATKFCDAPGPK